MCYVNSKKPIKSGTFKNCQSINAESACERKNKSMHSCFYESKKFLRCLNLIPNNESFKSRIESIQCKACVAITGAIQGTSRERLYRELGLESLSDRCWFRKLTSFYKIVKGLSPRYLTKYVNLRSTSNYQTRSANKNNLEEFSCRTESFKHSFFPFCVREWNKLDNTIRDAESIKQFKSMLKNFFSLNQRSLFSIHDPVGVIAYKTSTTIQSPK